jgi:hypothetical protein
LGRWVGDYPQDWPCAVSFEWAAGAAPVIFGEKDDSMQIGTLSLEALGMSLDPMKRELRPLPMILASQQT